MFNCSFINNLRTISIFYNRWLFNSTDTKFEIPSAESIMTFSNYRPSDGENHGQVLCWASNDLGEQVGLQKELLKICFVFIIGITPGN